MSEAECRELAAGFEMDRAAALAFARDARAEIDALVGMVAEDLWVPPEAA